MNTNSVENEIGILRSYRHMENVVKELNLHVQYFTEETFRSRELYLESPVTASVVSLGKAAVKEMENASKRTFRVRFIRNDQEVTDFQIIENLKQF